MSIINENPDPVREAIAHVNICGERIGDCIARELTSIISRVAPINGSFWSDSRIGTSGASLLAKLGAHVQFLATHFPDKLNAVILSAGSTLTANTDGTVTHTPAPEPPPELPPDQQG